MCFLFFTKNNDQNIGRKKCPLSRIGTEGIFAFKLDNSLDLVIH